MVDTQINLDGIKKFSSKLFSSFAYKPFNYSFASFTRLATVTKNTTISNEKSQNRLQHFIHHYPRFSQQMLSKEHLQHLLNNNNNNNNKTMKKTGCCRTTKQPPSQPHTTTQENITVDTFEQDFWHPKYRK